MAKPEIETAEHRAAFDLYLSLGKDRSFVPVAAKFGKSETAIANWSSAFAWGRRVIEAEKRIADKASSQVESELAKHQFQMIDIADKLILLFLHQIKGAFNKDGSVNADAIEAYRPKASDVKLWAEMKTAILAKAAGGASSVASGQIDAGAVDEMGVEVVERFIVERTTRLITARKRGPGGGGIVGMGALPGDPRGVHREPGVLGEPGQ